MKIHTLTPDHPLKSRKRIGRGGKRGTYSGKGMKGQRARSGAKIAPLFAGGGPGLTGQGSQIIHKKRGQGNTPVLAKKDVLILNISAIDGAFESGDVVSPETLIERGLVTKRIKMIKILGRGVTDKKFVFEGVAISKSVRDIYSA